MLNQGHRSDIDLPSLEPIIRSGRGQDKGENDNGPIHIDQSGHGAHGEKWEDKAHDQKHESDVVDKCTPSAERPAAREQRFVTPPLETDAANGDDVGEEQGRVGEADDGAEGDFGAEIESGDEEGDAQDYDQRIDGDVPAGPDL